MVPGGKIFRFMGLARKYLNDTHPADVVVGNGVEIADPGA